MNVGPEFSVAATKTFTATVLILLALVNLHHLINPDDIEDNIQRIEHSTKFKGMIDEKYQNIWIVGDSWGYGVAREVALKLQEVAYQNATTCIGYELKHGPLALIDEQTCVVYFGESDEIPEILKSRGAKVLVYKNMVQSIVTFQLLTYHIAKNKNLPIDKPRNLAKSVTV
jgi:glucosamine--fructose-6-phosphate aminotransferase (isomerizing)